MKDKVIIIPGLGDNVEKTRWATKHWKNHGLNTIIYPADWYSSESFSEKLNKLLKQIDLYAKNGDRISIIGCSAGASLALNTFFERKNVLNKAISICGRLRTGDQTGFRSLGVRARKSRSFFESVKTFENKENLLNMNDRNKIMTVRALFDELVPTSTSKVEGVENITVPTIEHTLAIYGALSIFSNPIISFIKK